MKYIYALMSLVVLSAFNFDTYKYFEETRLSIKFDNMDSSFLLKRYNYISKNDEVIKGKFKVIKKQCVALYVHEIVASIQDTILVIREYEQGRRDTVIRTKPFEDAFKIGDEIKLKFMSDSVIKTVIHDIKYELSSHSFRRSIKDGMSEW